MTISDSIFKMSVRIPLHKSWTCSYPPQAQWLWHQAPSLPAGCWHHENQWQGPSGPLWPLPLLGMLMLTAYLSGEGWQKWLVINNNYPGRGASVCMSTSISYLQVFSSFFIAGHKHKLGTDAAEMHVAQNCCTLYCCFICGLWKE